MRIALLLVLAVASNAVAGGPDSTYTAISKKAFGPLKAGKKVTKDALQKMFPTAVIKVVDGSAAMPWLVKDGVTGAPLLVAGPKLVIASRGKYELHGVLIGDDGTKLAAKELKGIECYPEEDSAKHAMCYLPWLTIRLESCARTGEDPIPPKQLGGCKVSEIYWLPLGRDKG